LQRRDVSRIVNDGLAWYRQFQPHSFAVETVAFQKVLLKVFQAEAERAKMIVNMAGVTHGRVGKRERIRGTITPCLAGRRLHFRKNSPGCAMLVQQLKTFPACKHDDGPDGLEIAITQAARAVNGGRAFGTENLPQEFQRART
jgi:Holliday junction resolvasome RuvABC endonuclease subunit